MADAGAIPRLVFLYPVAPITFSREFSLWAVALIKSGNHPLAIGESVPICAQVEPTATANEQLDVIVSCASAINLPFQALPRELVDQK